MVAMMPRALASPPALVCGAAQAQSLDKAGHQLVAQPSNGGSTRRWSTAPQEARPRRHPDAGGPNVNHRLH